MPHLYFQNVMIALDSLGKALIGGAPGETISGRAGRAREKGSKIAKYLCIFLDFLQSNHCAQAVLNDAKGRHRESVKF